MNTAVIIPALDEEAAIGRVLDAVPQGMACVVVDNGSMDRTAEVAQAHGALVVREPRRGYGSACLAGVAALRADPPDVVVFMDGDCSFDPGEIKLLLQGIEDGFDLVLGSRGSGTMPFHAALANRLFALLLRYYGLRLTDVGPFRAVRYETLSSLGMADQGYGFPIEMVIKAAKSGARIKEVPVSYRQRVGRSKVTGNPAEALKALLRILYTILRHALR